MPSLILISGPESAAHGVEEFDLPGAPQLIGRLSAAGCQIVLRDQAVSKQHARIIAENGRFFIADVGSHNGTSINNKKIPPNTPTPLKPGDRICICDYVFLFKEGDDIPTGDILNTETRQGTPTERLQALLALSADPDRAGDLTPLMNQVAETLFSGNLPQLEQITGTLLGVFKLAQRCLVLVVDETGRPMPKVTRTRNGAVDEGPYCRTLALRAIETRQSFHAATAINPALPTSRHVLCVPLITSEGAAIGAVILEADPKDAFTQQDLHLLGIVAHLASVAIEKVRTHEKVQAHEREQREFQLAQQVQLGFLPQHPPEVVEYEFFSHYSPARMVGGDYYDFITLPEGRVAVVVADVSGKGVPAALLVARLSSEVRYCLLTIPDLACAICTLNQQLMNGGLGDRFVSLAAMVIDRTAHTLTIVNAGHLSPKLHSTSTGKVTDIVTIEQTGFLIGIDRDYEYKSITIPLEPHDTVTAFTDGVTDAMNSNSAVFGPEAVERHLIPDLSQSPDAGRPKWIGQSLVNAVKKHTGGRVQNDDIAIVSFGRWEPESEHNTTLIRG